MEKSDTPSHREPGEILRDLRKVLAPEGAQKLTQAELAHRLGYDGGYMQSVETGRRPMQPHLVDKLAQLEDETRFPDAFARLLQELRDSVEAYWAELAARPPDIGGPPGDPLGAAGAALAESVTALGGKLETVRGAVEGLSARTEGRLDGLAGKVDRTEGTLAVLGTKLETTSARSDAAMGALGGKIDEASGKTQEALGALGDRVDGASAKTQEALGTLGEKVEEASAKTEGQLREVAVQVADVGNKIDKTDAKVESVRTQAAQTEKKATGKLDLLIRLACANLGLGVVGLAAVFILHCHHAPSAVQPAQEGTAKVGVGQGAAEGSVKEHCTDNPAPPCLNMLGAEPWGEFGKTAPRDKWLPSTPLEGQGLPPCDEGLGQMAINGGCWIRIDYVKPPCGRLYRKGDYCYAPIAASSKQPLGGEPRQATPERQLQ